MTSAIAERPFLGAALAGDMSVCRVESNQRSISLFDFPSLSGTAVCDGSPGAYLVFGVVVWIRCCRRSFRTLLIFCS